MIIELFKKLCLCRSKTLSNKSGAKIINLSLLTKFSNNENERKIKVFQNKNKQPSFCDTYIFAKKQKFSKTKNHQTIARHKPEQPNTINPTTEYSAWG
jgi:hypothetical protein